jgi:hypothetical protein
MVTAKDIQILLPYHEMLMPEKYKRTLIKLKNPSNLTLAGFFVM